MTPRDFCYWLQGYIELASADGTPVISKEKTKCIQNHLNMVFKHVIDPSFGDKKHVEELRKIHAGLSSDVDTKAELNC